MSAWLRARLVVDRVIAGVLLVCASPVIAVAAILVRRHDGGPSLIAVSRMGRNGDPIRMWKLRSMRADASDGTAAGVALTAANDQRVTPIGARLRARHLDELPQLYNVVRGEMCLFGPRPEAPGFVDLNDPLWQIVLCVPPGIAGPTQLIVGDWEREHITNDPSGTAYVDDVLPVKLAIDAWYVQQASARLDLQVMTSLLRRLGPGTMGGTLTERVRAEVPEVHQVSP
jgi:lipopolysaccharide/colanic/teichoic acid biosynthesis glycosyltransferase